MSRRRSRERPATTAEQQQIERLAELARSALDAPPEQRADAVRRMSRQADRLRDPGNLANVPTRELLAAIREQYPDDLEGVTTP